MGNDSLNNPQGNGGFLSGLSSLFRSSATSSAPSSNQSGIATELSSALDSLKAAIQAEKEQLRRATLQSALNDSVVSDNRSNESSVQDLEQAINLMRSSIVELHGKLSTNITENEICSLEDFFVNLVEQCSGSDIDARIRAAIADKLFRELGDPTWNMLLKLMDKAGMQWPEPGGIMPNLTKEERARAVQYKIDEARDLFLAQSIKLGVQNMCGIVSAWKRYPETNSWLWQEVALRGVASSLRCCVMREAVTELRNNADRLKAQANALIATQMEKINSVLNNGVRSLDSAEEIVRGTDLVVTELLPDLALTQISSMIPVWNSKFSN